MQSISSDSFLFLITAFTASKIYFTTNVNKTCRLKKIMII